MQKGKNLGSSKQKRRGYLRVVGCTEDGKKVISGIFKFYSSIAGLPLDVIVESIQKENSTIDWIAFLEDALAEGWTVKRVFEKIETALDDVLMQKYKDEVVKRLKFYLLQRKSNDVKSISAIDQ